MKIHVRKSFIILISLLVQGFFVVAQPAFTFTTGSLIYSENFDTLGSAGTSYNTGWTGIRFGGSGSIGAVLNPVANNGGSNSGAVYNVGTTSASDRALGTLASGTTSPAIGSYYVNGTGSYIGTIDVTYFGEQWRSGSSNTANEKLEFAYSFDASSLNSGNWVFVPALDFNEILTSTTAAAAVNGNDSANRVQIASSISNIFWAPGDTLWIRWVDADNPASDGMYAVDDLEIEVTLGNPPPQLFKLQILHASDLEGGIEAIDDAPRFAAVIDTLEGTYANTLVLSSGDNFIPSPFLFSGEDPTLQPIIRSTASSYFKGATTNLRAAIGRVDIAIMNIIGFQASCVGNHEFDLGSTELNSMIGMDIRPPAETAPRWIGAQFPYLSANLNYSADASLNYLSTNQRLEWTAFKTDSAITNNNQKIGLAPSAIITVNGEKIGIVGATTQVLQSISSPLPTTVVGPTTNDMPALAAILQPVIDSLIIAEGINKVVLLSHLQQLSLEQQLAGLISGVDIIIAGGSHTLLADSTDRLRSGDVAVNTYPLVTQSLTSQPCLILNTEANYRYVGRLVVDFDTAGILQLGSLDASINGAYATDSLGVVEVWGNYNNAFAAGTKGNLVKQLCDGVRQVIINKDGNVFGKTSVYLEGRRGFVRTEETNMGNISSDANLWQARQVDSTVQVSIKNGGGIRSSIGEVFAVGSTITYLPPQANPIAGKQTGDISQLDIENSLRFNNRLWVVTTNAAGLRRLIEHGVSATTASSTPGQFPQVSGVRFSYDISLPANARVRNMALVNDLGNVIDTIVFNGNLVGDTTRTIKVVTLNFLATGGDSYPFPQVATDILKLDTIALSAGQATFAVTGSEQDAFAEYIKANFDTNPYNEAETPINLDLRIQRLNVRTDSVLINFGPTAVLSPFGLLAPADSGLLVLNGSATDTVQVTWAPSTFNGPGTITYEWLVASPTTGFTPPLVILPSDNSGVSTHLTLTQGIIDGLLAQNGVSIGDTVTIVWTVVAKVGNDTLLANAPYSLDIVRAGLATGITEIQLDDMIRVFPNPASESITVVSNGLVIGHIEVMSMLGETMISMEPARDGGNILDTSGLATGVYQVRMYTNEGIVTKKILKVHK